MSEPEGRFLTSLQFMSVPASIEFTSPQLRSWIATGPNEPVTAEQVTALVGDDAVTALADAVHRDKAQVVEDLTVTLPKVIDAASPDGELPPGTVRVYIQDDRLGAQTVLIYAAKDVASVAPVAAPDQYWALGQ